jgi:glutathione S-transferase
MAEPPVLWHLKVSHYNEKARWALDHKRIPHVRRALIPGRHDRVALKLSGGSTLPVLVLDDGAIGDSTRIIEALEQRWPDPPLYPAEPEARRRALELEDWFDEELGPHARLLLFHEYVRDRERLEAVAAHQAPGPLARTPALAARIIKAFTSIRYGVQREEKAELARRKILEALNRLESELGEHDYLVGDRFSVADLTAAALFYPLVQPPEGPVLGAPPPDAIERFRAPHKERRAYRWVEEIFRRHRREAPDATRSAA